MGVRYAACADESRPAIRIAKAGSRFCNATLRLAPPRRGPRGSCSRFRTTGMLEGATGLPVGSTKKEPGIEHNARLGS